MKLRPAHSYRSIIQVHSRPPVATPTLPTVTTSPNPSLKQLPYSLLLHKHTVGECQPHFSCAQLAVKPNWRSSPTHLSAGCWAGQQRAQSPQGWLPGTHTAPRRGLQPEWCAAFRKAEWRDGGPKVMGCPLESRQSPAEGNRSPHRENPQCDLPGLTDPVVWR